MTQVTLSAKQRLSIEVIISTKRGKQESLFVVWEILKKVKLSDEDKEMFVKELPDGRILTDQRGMASIPDATVDLEKAEVRELRSELTKFENFTAADMDWLQPLLKQLPSD